MPKDVDGKQNQRVNAQIQAYLDAYTALTGMAPGDVFFVSSVTGSASYPGNSVNKPRATIESCFTTATVLVEANKGDIIFALPGHVETVIAAGGLDLDIAGVTIIFLGDGAARAQVNFGTDVDADMDVDAASITLVRPKFVAAIDALTGPIDVNAADFTIHDGVYYDAVGIDTTDAIVAVPASIRMRILGYRYYAGDEAGTQKDSHIQLNGVDDAILQDIDIRGDFDIGNIENVTDEVLNIRLKDIFLENLNADPSPAMFIDANATGLAENVKIRIESGTTYVSNVGKINWWNSHGANADGYDISDPIGTAMATGLEAQIAVIDASVGDLTDVAADTTDTATVIALLRQIAEVVNNGTGSAIGTDLSLVDIFGAFDGGADPQGDIYQAIGPTTASSLNELLGALDSAAAAGAVTDADNVIAYIKQLVTAELVALGLRGALTDVAADTTDTATMVALLRQIVEAVNNGTGSAIGTDLSLVDIFGAFDGGADPQGDIYQALGVDATNSVKALIDAVQAGNPQIAVHAITFTAGGDGAVSQHTLFTVTGTVKVKVYAVCTTVTSIQAGSTISVGTATTVDGIIAVTNSDAPDAGEIWHDATPDSEQELSSVVVEHIISDGNDITYDVLVDTIDSGVIEFYCEWVKVSDDGNVVAA